MAHDNTPLTDADCIKALAALREHGSVSNAAVALGMTRNQIAHRRRLGEARGLTADSIPAPPAVPPAAPPGWLSQNLHPASERVDFDHAFTVAFWTDAHFWPDDFGGAFYAFCEWLEHVQPDVVVDLGDAFDGARISRHPKGGWDTHKPTMLQELDANREAWGLIRNSAREADHYRIPGNHGQRFSRYLATNASEFAGMPGATLEEYFTSCRWAESLLIQGSLFCTHSMRGGLHAGWNNTLHGGLNVATGHTHRLSLDAKMDARGRRWGMQCGTLAPLFSGAFSYHGHSIVSEAANGWGYVEVEPDGTIHPEIVYFDHTKGRARWRSRNFAG